jgi:beta-lactam-binding protein with PASTA domain
VEDDLVSQATETLQNDGFTVSGVAGNPNGTVVGTDPPAGTSEVAGTPVQILSQ